MDNKNIDMIKNTVIDGYIKGIHEKQDQELAESGFHPDFEMLVLQNNRLSKVGITNWLARIDEMKEKNPELWNSETSYKFLLVDCTEVAAVAKIDVFKGDIHFSTDYMLLYKFEEGWRIVSKVFSIPQ